MQNREALLDSRPQCELFATLELVACPWHAGTRPAAGYVSCSKILTGVSLKIKSMITFKRLAE